MMGKLKRGVFTMQNKTLKLTETALLIALLISLQALTRAGGQFVTGSCVNAVLGVAALFSGLYSAVAVALLSPFFAFLLGIGPQLLPIVPAIALGNLVYVLLLFFLLGKKDSPAPARKAAGLGIASLCKFLTLNLVVVQLLCRVLPLKEAQVKTFSAMFSYPQLITALIGGVLALLLVPALKKALKR